MISRLLQLLHKPSETAKEIEHLRGELAIIRSLAEDELRGMIVDIKFDTMMSLAELRKRVDLLEKSNRRRKGSTQEYLTSFIIGDKPDLPNPGEVLKH